MSLPAPKGIQPYRTLITAALVVLAALILATPASAQEEPPPTPTPDPRFGAVEAFYAPDEADAAGVGWTRILFYWNALQPDGPDSWNAGYIPMGLLDRELAGGREVVGLLISTPDWASDTGGGIGVPRGLYLPVDDPANEWAAFVRQAVAAYQGRVDRWIIWNEPDIAADTYGVQWAGSVEDYYQLVKVAYLAAHEVNPDVKIHLAGLTFWHDPWYLEKFLQVAAADPTAEAHDYYFNVISLHVYFKPATVPVIVQSIRYQLVAYNVDKPIWINETNAAPYDDPAYPWPDPLFALTQDQQAAFILQASALALAQGVERVSVYKWIDVPSPPLGYEPYGLLRPDHSLRPAYTAYRLMTQYYAGVNEALDRSSRDVRQIVLTRERQTTRVLWATTPEALTVTVPALAGSAQLIDSTGAEQTLTAQGGMYTLTLPGAPYEVGEEYLIGGTPVLLVEEGILSAVGWSGLAVPRSQPVVSDSTP